MAASPAFRLAATRGPRAPRNDGDSAFAQRLHLPADVDDGRRHRAVVLSTPAGPMHVAAGALYARKLAARGFVALVAGPGRDTAVDRNVAIDRVEDERVGDDRVGIDRVADIRRAVDRLASLPFVDATRIALLGLCSGGADAVDAALVEDRIRALGTVAGSGTGNDGHAGTAGGARLLQPLMVIVGGRDGSHRDLATGRALYGRARGPDKALVVIPGADHHDLQHRDACVDPAIDRLAPFFAFHLDP